MIIRKWRGNLDYCQNMTESERDLQFDVAQAVEKLILDCQYDGHNEHTFLHAVIDEIDEYLGEQHEQQR